MILASLLLLTGLTLSSVAIYYSVAGLATIFAANAVPVYIMGTTLEIAKLVGASWLKSNWHRAPFFIRSYMLIAIFILMAITSIGIFGFLSRSHADQGLVGGDVVAQVELIDQKIATQRDNIQAAQRTLSQLNVAVEETIARTKNERGTAKAVTLRRTQAKERTELQKEISSAQQIIAELQEQRAPIASNLRQVTAETGPIRYLAAFVYGTNPNAGLLEKSVTWLIIIIVIVFDPLAVVMILSAQISFKWAREEPKIVEGAPTVTQPGVKLIESDDVADESAKKSYLTKTKQGELKLRVVPPIPE